MYLEDVKRGLQLSTETLMEALKELGRGAGLGVSMKVWEGGATVFLGDDEFEGRTPELALKSAMERPPPKKTEMKAETKPRR